MPLGVKPECIQCRRTESAMWRSTELGSVCNECSQKHKEELQLSSNSNGPNRNGEFVGTTINLRSSTKAARVYKTRYNTLPKSQGPKGKGRRSLSKKAPTKSPSAGATTVTCKHIFYKGQFFQQGDVISMIDLDGGTFYAQADGFMIDSYGEKSVVFAWLLPSTSSPDPSLGFEPSTYMIGPDEQYPRRMECVEFVMHLPYDYYRSRYTPYPSVPQKWQRFQPGYIWTRLY